MIRVPVRHNLRCSEFVKHPLTSNAKQEVLDTEYGKRSKANIGNNHLFVKHLLSDSDIYCRRNRSSCVKKVKKESGFRARLEIFPVFICRGQALVLIPKEIEALVS